MKIRDMKYPDILKVCELERECFKTPWTHQMLSDSFMTGSFHAVIAETEDGIIAYGGFTAVYEDANITNIAVTETERNRGTGAAILEKLIEKCKALKVERIFLEVRPSNGAARHLYRKYGFMENNLRKNYYEDGEDAIVMSKKFVWSD